MDESKNLVDSFREMYHLTHIYSMMWYRKNFGGIDPMQGQGRILSALRLMHSTGQKELGLALDIRPQSLGELLQKLENNGYIRRYRSPTDKRALIVELTEKGEVFQLTRPNYDVLFEKMSMKECVEFQRTMQKISADLRILIEREEDDDFFF